MNSTESRAPDAILAIDDERGILELVRETLEGEGYRVHTATKPRDAIQLYAESWRDIQLVLSDFTMPEMKGDLVLENLRQINPDVQAILVTGYGEPVARKMLAMGVRGCLEKPFHLEDLVHCVDEALAGGQTAVVEA